MTTSLNTLDPAVLALLGKQLTAAAKVSRKDLAVGTHSLDCDVTLRLDGTVKVGEVYTQRVVAKADPWALLATALSKLNGVTVKAIVAGALDKSALDEVSIEAIAAESIAADKDKTNALKTRAATAIAAVKAPTLTTCNGKVTTSKDSAVSVVSTAPARQAEVVIVSEEAA